MKKYLIKVLILRDSDNFVLNFDDMNSRSILHRTDLKYYVIEIKRKKSIKKVIKAYSKRNNLEIIILDIKNIRDDMNINQSTVKVVDVIKLNEVI